MEVYEVDSTVRGHHIFKEIWMPFIGEDIECKEIYQIPEMHTVVCHSQLFISKR